MVKSRPMYKKNTLLMAEMMLHGYTIRSLAEAADVHYLTIWRIVNRAHRPNLQTAQRICDLLQTKPHKVGLQPWGGKGKAGAAAADAATGGDSAAQESAEQ